MSEVPLSGISPQECGRLPPPPHFSGQSRLGGGSRPGSEVGIWVLAAGIPNDSVGCRVEGLGSALRGWNLGFHRLESGFERFGVHATVLTVPSRG